MPPHRFVIGKPVFGAFYNDANPNRYAMKKLGTVVRIDPDGTATLSNGKTYGRMTWPLFLDRDEAKRWADEHPPKLPFGGNS